MSGLFSKNKNRTLAGNNIADFKYINNELIYLRIKKFH